MEATSATVSSGGVIRQAEDDEVDLAQQRPLGRRILAVLGREALQGDVRPSQEPLADAETRGARLAVDEYPKP